MNPAMVTTAFELPNHRIVQSLGVVRGVTVRSRSMLGTIGATLQTIMGGNISLLTELCEKSRAEAFGFMLRHATDLGANAIPGPSCADCLPRGSEMHSRPDRRSIASRHS